MNTLPWSGDLLSLADWDALPEDEAHRRFELVEGVLVMTPKPVSDHQVAMVQLAATMNAALPTAGLFAVADVDVVLTADPLPTVRAPDISVVRLDVVRRSPARFDAGDLLVAVEIMSPGSRRTDRIMKAADYADAGIPSYWIVDLEGRPALDVLRLVDGRYEPVLRGATGRVRVESPIPLELDLDALLP